ncbi:hypothetical protein THAOC_37541, partial [Thalassiosira oceanica]
MPSATPARRPSSSSPRRRLLFFNRLLLWTVDGDTFTHLLSSYYDTIYLAKTRAHYARRRANRPRAWCAGRCHGTASSDGETAPFDRHVKLRQRTRAADACRQYYNHFVEARSSGRAAGDDAGDSGKPVLPYDYFHREVAQRLIERLDDINIQDEGFPLALEVGANSDFVYDAIVEGCDDNLALDEEDDNDVEYVGGRGGVRKLVQVDSCASALHRDEIFSSPDEEGGEAGS